VTGFHVDFTYTSFGWKQSGRVPGPRSTRKLFLFRMYKAHRPTFSEVRGKKLGQVVAQNGSNLVIHGQGGFIEVHAFAGTRQEDHAGEAELPLDSILAPETTPLVAENRGRCSVRR